MHLASDYIHPTPHEDRCRVRIFLPDRMGDAPVIMVSEHAENTGETVTSSIERIVAEVVHHHDFSDLLFPIVIEHHPPEATDGKTETFSLVTFEDEGLGIVRIATSSGREYLSLGEPEWKELDRGSVEGLVGRAEEIEKGRATFRMVPDPFVYFTSRRRG